MANDDSARPEAQESGELTAVEATREERLARLEEGTELLQAAVDDLLEALRGRVEVHAVAFPDGPVRALRVRLEDGRLAVLVDEQLDACDRQAAVDDELKAEARR